VAGVSLAETKKRVALFFVQVITVLPFESAVSMCFLLRYKASLFRSQIPPLAVGLRDKLPITLLPNPILPPLCIHPILSHRPTRPSLRRLKCPLIPIKPRQLRRIPKVIRLPHRQRHLQTRHLLRINQPPRRRNPPVQISRQKLHHILGLHAVQHGGTLGDIVLW